MVGRRVICREEGGRVVVEGRREGEGREGEDREIV